jgi:hypothetical protein
MRTQHEIKEDYFKVCAKIGELSVRLIIIQNTMDPLLKEALELEKEFLQTKHLTEELKK